MIIAQMFYFGKSDNVEEAKYPFARAAQGFPSRSTLNPREERVDEVDERLLVLSKELCTIMVNDTLFDCVMRC